MNRSAISEERYKRWKLQLAAAYASGAFSVLGLLGAAENHSRLEADVSVIALGFAVLWALVAQVMIRRHQN